MSEQEKIRVKPLSVIPQQSTSSTLQRTAVNTAPVQDTPDIINNVIQSPGQPMDTETQAFMEPRFGHDFSSVRVHTDEQAAESARSVNALAYTVGHDVVFGAGQYAPTTMTGKRLLAHELTHVVQQNQTGTIHRYQEYHTISNPGDIAEKEADAIGEQVISSGTELDVPSGPHQAAMIQRKEATDQETDNKAATNEKTTDQETGSKIQTNKASPASNYTFKPVVIESHPEVLSNFNDFVKKFSQYLQHFRDANQDACAVFINTMKSETHETAKPDVMNAIFKKGWELGKKKLVKAVGEHVPGLEDFVELYEAAEKEVERAEKAEKEADLVDFINKHIINVGEGIQKIQEQLESDDQDILVNLYQAASDSGDDKAFSEKVRDLGTQLHAPTDSEILREMTSAYVRTHERTDINTTFGVTQFRTGILYLKYIVDKEQTKATLVEKKLSSPYAAQIKSLLSLTYGEQVDTAELGFTRVVRLEREDLHIINDIDVLHAGERDPGYRGLGYFARFVKKMPTINVDDIKVTNEPIITE